MNSYVGIVLALCVYSIVVFGILAVMAAVGEAGERFDQTIADHYHAVETTTTDTLPPQDQP